MNKPLPATSLEKRLRFFGGAFLGLISSLLILQAFYFLSGSWELHGFMVHWLNAELRYLALIITLGFTALGAAAVAWITNEKDLREWVIRAQNLEKNSRDKSEFISFFSHEIRSPVTIIRYSIQMLLEGRFGKFTDKQNEVLTKSYHAVEEMSSLLMESLDNSKMENEKMELVLRSTAMATVTKHIKSILDEFAPLMNQKKITLQTESSTVQERVLNIDSSRIFQVVRNLLQNSINYTPQGGSIKVTLQTTEDELRFSIADNGIGIPRQEQPKIFNKFYRAQNARMVRSTGTGLGLYLCRKLIEGHEGKIWFTSEENRGTVFVFTLPLKTGIEIEDLFRKI